MWVCSTKALSFTCMEGILIVVYDRYTAVNVLINDRYVRYTPLALGLSVF